MGSPGWYIVKFLEENTVEAVPCNWLYDFAHCYWPPYSKTKTVEAIRNRENPSKSWKLHKLKIVSKKKITDYFIAMNKANIAQYDSDIPSETENISKNVLPLPLNRTRKPNSKFQNEDSSSENSEDYGNKKIKIPSYPTFSNNGNFKCRCSSKTNILNFFIIYNFR